MAPAAESSTFVPQYEPQVALLEEYYEQNPLPTLAPPPPWPSHAPTMAWKADDLHVDNQHITYLSDAEQREIMAACAVFTGPVPLLAVCLPNVIH
jgi:hypothetical protein